MIGTNIFQAQAVDDHEESFWPSFTDIMMVIVMIFLLVTVAVVLANTRLLSELRNSLLAQQEASQLAEFTLKENSTLEEQLEYYQRLASATEMELLQTRAKGERMQADLDKTRTELQRAQANIRLQDQQAARQQQQLTALQQDLTAKNTESSRLQTELQQAELALATETSRLQTELEQTRTELSSESERLQAQVQQLESALATSQADVSAKDTALLALRAQADADRQQLASLEGDYADLDKKYQKLLKPSRSAKNKTVVEVMYQRSGYRIRAPGEAAYRTVGAAALDSELAVLQAQHGNDLYVKIVIPENSGLSYNDAWAFTRDTLNKYDYYYQADSSQPIE